MGINFYIFSVTKAPVGAVQSYLSPVPLSSPLSPRLLDIQLNVGDCRETGQHISDAGSYRILIPQYQTFPHGKYIHNPGEVGLMKYSLSQAAAAILISIEQVSGNIDQNIFNLLSELVRVHQVRSDQF